MAYYFRGMKWTRSLNRADGAMTWQWRKGGSRLRIFRNRWGSYYVMNGVHHGPYTRLTEAFRVAAGVAGRT